MHKCSLITIAYNRNFHLRNVLRGVTKGFIMPDEIIVVDIGGTVDLEPDIPMEVKVVEVDKPGNSIPLAAARNLGAKEARFDHLIFLDVDCIPSMLFVDKINRYLHSYDGLIMGFPRYLKTPVRKNFSDRQLKRDSIEHPERPSLEVSIKNSLASNLFSSLCFGIRTANFEKIGGFDTTYCGYGGEDTDFALMARENGIPFFLSDAVAYHQQHPMYYPPVNHLGEIIANSNIFWDKWGQWPMQKWLGEFNSLGLIKWDTATTAPIQQLSVVDEPLLQKCRREKARFI